MKSISLNQYLSISNPWTCRIIGITPFSKKRDLEQIEREYNRDKYGSLIEFDFQNIELYKIKEFELAGLSEKDATVISFGEKLFESNIQLVRSIYYSAISSIVEKYHPQRLCELGCGYGYNLWYLRNICPEVYGGEYSKNAVDLGNRLGMDLQVFNYYNLEDYQIIRDRSVILTIHSIEQIPSATSFLQGLESQRQKIDLVINFEPCFLEARTSLLGTFRNRYMELNDYNRDLVSLLRDREDIEILEYQQDYIGLNPLNSANLVVWKFK